MMITLMMMFASTFSTHAAHAGPDDTAYFNQFVFQKQNTSTDPDFPTYQYRYLTSAAMITFVDANQKTILASANIQLYPDGHYEMNYQELMQMVMPGSPAGTPPMQVPHGCKFLKGVWSVPDTALVMENIGTGARDYDANNAFPQEVKITFDQNIISTGLVGVSVSMSYGVGIRQTFPKVALTSKIFGCKKGSGE